MRKVICCWLIAGVAASIARTDTYRPSTEIFSPDRRFSVKIIDTALPGSDPYTGFFTIVLQNQGKILSEYPTIGYLINLFWSPGGTSVAVNNRRGIDGDYLWI